MFFLVLAAGGALCQERREHHTWNSLPDAPSAGLPVGVPDEGHLAFVPNADGFDAVLTRAPEYGNNSLTWTSAGYFDSREQESARNFFQKYLYVPLARPNYGFHPSTSGTLMGRVGYAASSIFVTEDDSGKRRVNTSYFVGMLGSAFLHTAYRPYWRRSVSDPFSDFGSNIGNDAGMNFLHEFGPGIQQLVKSHAPKFVYKIEERINHN
jgi:hypothetical protein